MGGTARRPGIGRRVAADVFWPVVVGCPLAYQAEDAVDVQAFCNFQPMVCSHFWPPWSDSTATTDVRTLYYGQWAGPRRRSLASPISVSSVSGAFTNILPTHGDHEVPVTFPVSPCLYNDAAAVLDLL